MGTPSCPEPPIITAALYLELREGVDELVASIEAKGVPISALKDQSYGMREATVHDPDGNEIYIGQPLHPSTARAADDGPEP